MSARGASRSFGQPAGSGTSADGYYPPAGYGLTSLSDTPALFDGDSTFTDGTFFVVRMWAPANTAIAAVGVGVHTAATGSAANTNGAVIYEDDGTVAQQQANANMWSGTGWRFTDLATPVAAQSAGRFVRVGILCGGWSGVHLWYANRTTGAEAVLNGGRASTHRRCVFASSVTAFPSSITPASYGTTSAFLPLVGLA